MLRTRLIAAACILTPVLLVFWVDAVVHLGMPGIWLTCLGVTVSAGVAWEVCQLLANCAPGPRTMLAVLGTTAVLISSTLPYLLRSHFPSDWYDQPWLWTTGSLLVVMSLLFAVEMFRFEAPGTALPRLALTLLVVVYVALPFCFLFALRMALPHPKGWIALFSVIAVTKTADAGAYFVGRSWGRRRLAPILSPKKTIEGACGGVAVACAVAWSLHTVVQQSSWAGHLVAWSVPAVLAYGASLALAGLVGDLAESLIKRDRQQKDSSHLLPGLGGLLDIFDSLTFAGPLGYFWWCSGLLG